MTLTATYAVTQAAGLPETTLPYELLAKLPTSVSAAPWQTRCEVVTWLHPLDDAALETLPETIRPAGIALVAWALVRYADTPVGPYSEIAATLIPADGSEYGHIPFIVVDSLASIVGGRANWLLPKALARFDWADDGLSVATSSEQPETPAWSINVRYTVSGDAAPLTMANHVQQVSTEGVVRRFDGEVSGSMRSATIDVDGQADGPLATLLRPGHYDGSVMSDCQFDVGPLND
jgi:Acetoacetate decarboxylase (ADC)